MSILGKWHSFRGLPEARRSLLIEAVCWLLAARLAILLLPFPLIARGLGRLHPPNQGGARGASDQAAARSIAWAIDRAARLLPFRLACLPRALAAQRVLARMKLDCRVHFGVTRLPGNEKPATHAWVDSGGVPITGYPEALDSTEIGYYARPCQVTATPETQP
jgi:hypothetical protein